MNKEERQARHLERLRRQKEKAEKASKCLAYYWRFYDAAIKQLRELPPRSSDHPYMATILHLPSFDVHLNCRIEWNDESAFRTRKTWDYDADYPIFHNMTENPDGGVSPDEYWSNAKPTIVTTQDQLSLNDINEIIRIVSDARMPIQAPIPENVPEYLHEMAAFLKVPVRKLSVHSQCIDGESFELTFAQGEAISIWK